MPVNNVKQVIKQLEQEELEDLHKENSELYIKLFAAYLHENELSSARYLWKRIPQNLKNNAELAKLHEVYVVLWNNNTETFFQVAKYSWSKTIEAIMNNLEDKIRTEILDLIGKAYTSIFDNVLIEKANISSENIQKMCDSLNWKIEECERLRLITPTKKLEMRSVNACSEDQLLILTDFVSFLEN